MLNHTSAYTHTVKLIYFTFLPENVKSFLLYLLAKKYLEVSARSLSVWIVVTMPVWGSVAFSDEVISGIAYTAFMVGGA